MSENLATINELDKITIAANWKSELEHPEFGDPNYRVFVQLMTYRREIAQTYLSDKSEENKNKIKLIINECNDKIKKILAL